MAAGPRPPAVAGRFYPADAAVLAPLVDRMLDAVPVPADDRLAAAYIVPHAGYRFSGPTAAQVYARLRRHAGQVRRVLLVGPTHYVPVAGCVAPAAGAWGTPLGTVEIDRAGVDRLVRAAPVAISDGPHALEHSLEVQVPFLQRALPAQAAVLPVVVGSGPAGDVALALAAVAEPGTVILCSTDLSHYLDLAEARRRDRETCDAVLALEPDRIGPRDACGAYALRGLLAWARGRGSSAALLGWSNSADATGDATRVVGYAAFAFPTPAI